MIGAMKGSSAASAAIFLICLASIAAKAQSAPEGIWAPYVKGDLEAEVVGELPAGVGNIAFTPSGELVYSHHPFYGNPVKVAKMNPDGKGFTPYPSESWNTSQDDENTYVDTVLGIRSDANGVVWMSDMMHGDRKTPKLVGWNTVTDMLEAVLPIPAPATLPCNADSCASQLNDFVIDDRRGKFYFADEAIGPGGDASQAALVVLDRNSGAARRVLEGHWSTLPSDVPIIVDGQPLTLPNGPNDTHTPILVGADGITADLDFEWLYYAPLNGGWVYRVRIDDLVDESLSDDALGAKVEKYAVKPNAGGLSIDADGNLYFTAVESTYVGIIPPDTRRFRAFASHPDLQWPDGVSYSPDGHMYVSAAELPQLPPFNDGVNYSEAPYHIFRFKPLAESAVGR
ncbi:MAG: L-dopachrome tautomerase-related protein [Pseudomonadota bacterium]